jgi:hypothetical protein
MVDGKAPGGLADGSGSSRCITGASAYLGDGHNVRRAKGDLASTMALTKDKARRWQCTWVQSAVRRRSQHWPGGDGVTPGFKAKTRCSSYVCLGSSCHTYGQNVSTENQCLYYIVSYYKNLLKVHKGLNSGMDTILPQEVDWGFRTPRRGLHQSTPHLLSSRA